MDLILTWVIALAVVLLWIIGVYFLYKRGIIKKEGHVSLFGPAVMLKTTRGKTWIEKAGRHRIWEAYGYLSVLLSLTLMILVFILMVWQAYMITFIPPSRAPSPVEALGIPGINPVIPVWYGILGLVVAIVLHELSHGLLVAYHRLKIRSLGILLFIFPIGAFVEPDEEELSRTDRFNRMQVFAAGPITNILVALVSLIIFAASVSSVSPAANGVYVSSVYGPNMHALEIGDIIESVNSTPIKSIDDLVNISAPVPGEEINLTVYRGGEMTVSAVSGVVVMSVIRGYPAYKAGIKPGWIFYSINGSVVRNEKDFISILNKTRAGERINITMLDENLQKVNIELVLGDKYEYYKKYAPESNRDYFKGKGFIGVSAFYLGVSVGEPEKLKEMISNPYSGAKTWSDMLQASLTLIALPFAGLMPFPSQYENMFIVPFPGFWIFVNAIYWIFWLNLMLGMTNLLPAVPLDGGYVFRDAIHYLATKLKVKDPNQTSARISSFMSFLILFLILWQFLGPRV